MRVDPATDVTVSAVIARGSMSAMQIGEHWVFRDRPKALGEPVHRVEVVRIEGPRRQGDVHVRFMAGEEAGLQEWVMRGQMIALWSDVEPFLQDDRRRLAVVEESVDVRGTPEYDAARFVIDFACPKTVLRLHTTKTDAGVAEIFELAKIATLTGIGPDELTAQSLCFVDRNGVLVCSWSATRTMARRIADKLGEEILGKVLDQERRLRDHYDSAPSWQRDDKDLRQVERLANVLREWCIGEVVERFDELRALREEVVRLGELVQRAAAELRRRKAHAIAATIERDLGALDATSGADTNRR